MGVVRLGVLEFGHQLLHVIHLTGAKFHSNNKPDYYALNFNIVMGFPKP